MSCPVCGAPGPFPALEQVGRFTMHVCPLCDLDFADPLEEAGAGFYDDHALYTGPETRYASARLLNWDQRRFLADAPARGARLLDVGCGTGQFLAAARAAGYRVTGIDLSPTQVELARRRFRLPDVQALSLEALAARHPAPFDVVTAFQVLEHVADPRTFLVTLHAIVASGGHLALGVPHRHGWRALRDPRDVPPNHLTRWSPTALRRALDASGFEALQVRQHRSVYNFLLRHVRLGLLRRLMRRTAAAHAAGRVPSPAVLALAIGKARALMALDIPAGALLAAVGAPGVELYALARARA
jgi:SAM-dependent methyltransferase